MMFVFSYDNTVHFDYKLMAYQTFILAGSGPLPTISFWISLCFWKDSWELSSLPK